MRSFQPGQHPVGKREKTKKKNKQEKLINKNKKAQTN